VSQLDFTTSSSLKGSAGLKKTDDLSKKFEFDENNLFRGFWAYVDTVIENMGVINFDPNCDPDFVPVPEPVPLDVETKVVNEPKVPVEEEEKWHEYWSTEAIIGVTVGASVLATIFVCLCLFCIFGLGITGFFINRNKTAKAQLRPMKVP